jgi:AcrR family transcriptional regulator
MVVHDSDATKRRLLDAAAAEFSAHGIAGARVARIAENARANKQLIYAYFGNKEGLFAAAFEDRINDFLASVRFDENDLPEFAGRMFDKFDDTPIVRRMTQWYHIERSPGDVPLPIIVESTGEQVERIRVAQEEGRVPAAYPAEVLLGLVRSITLTWHSQVPEMRDRTAFPKETKREMVVAAVKWLLEDPVAEVPEDRRITVRFPKQLSLKESPASTGA